MAKLQRVYLIPLGIAAAVALLTAFGLLSTMEYRLYDGFLKMRPDPPQDKNLVLVEVDDPSVAEVGTWPISRSITADALFLLKEMGARMSVFDIEYVNKSPRGVNASVLEETYPALLTEGFSKMSEDNTALVQALRTHRIPLSEAPSFATQFAQASDAKKKELVDALKSIAVDNDQQLAQANQIFDGSILTLRLLKEVDKTVLDADRKTALTRYTLPGILGIQNLPDNPDFIPTIEPILSSAKALGFVNVTIDQDGVRRRVDLVQRYQAAGFPQLGFAAYLELTGHPTVEIRPDSVVIHKAVYPDGKTYDVTVPRAQDGSVLLNWPHTKFDKSFRHLSFGFLYEHDQLFNNLINNIEARSTWGYLDLYKGASSLTDQAEGVVKLRKDLLDGDAPPEAIADFRAARDSFLKEFGTYLAEKPDDNLRVQLAVALVQKNVTADQKKEYNTIQADLPDWFAKTRDIYNQLMKIRTDEKILGNLGGTVCFLGNTNTGSTDLGTTPFQEQYPNLGTHASVANMLLSRQFVSDASPWWSWGIGFVGAMALTILLRGRKPLVSILVGTGVSVAAIAAFAIVFIGTGLYLPVLPMAGILVVSFLGATGYQFLRTEKEKGFLRNAFSRYLSNEVIKQIIANPDQLKLGGQQKVMTAMFTDIRGFSTISEKMTPEELVFLLNQYLTSMSDIVLDMGGTIDKYEGDAIIAFFGAPLDLEDHARRACLAAVRMKRVEDDLNKRFLEEKLTPLPLLTRIGINSGPMVVGNMGTNRKMDYTIIGDAVNLAARLEGVNKRYGSWILISEDTKNQMGDAVITRKLDRVRVVGKSVPIRLFQVVEEKGNLPEGVGKLLEVFHQALDRFEERKWTEAKTGFTECLKLFPDDGPSTMYLKLAAEYEKAPPPEAWDGVFKMETK